MAQVDVTINGRSYQIACDDGQEDHLVQLGEYVDKRLRELVAAVGQVGDSRLLVMVSLLIADELAETYADLKRTAGQSGETEPGSGASDSESAVAAVVDATAARIEDLVAEIENSRAASRGALPAS